MSACRIILVLCLCAGFAASSRGGANAQTPTPTSLPVFTATPVPLQPAVFGGSVWVDARRVADRDVTAKIGDTVCAHQRAPLVSPPPGSAPIYGVVVPSEEVVPVVAGVRKLVSDEIAGAVEIGCHVNGNSGTNDLMVLMRSCARVKSLYHA
jgi:hypothetical protein